MSDLKDEDKQVANKLMESKNFDWTKETCQLFTDAFGTLISLVAGTTVADANLYFIGRLGRYEYTAAAGVATVLYNSLAFGPIICMSTGFGNIGSQLVGAGKLQELGLMFHSSLIFNVFISFLGYGLLILASKLLGFTNLGEFTTQKITSYVSLVIMAILGVAIANPLRNLLVSQQNFSFQTKIIFPICILHIFWSWLFTFPFDLGFEGSPLAIGLTETLIAFILFVYVWIWHSESKVWVPFSVKSFTNIPRYLKKTIHMALVMYVEWVCFEIMTFLCSYLGEFQMAVFTTYVNVLTTWYMIPLALSITFGTRVGNAMGAFEPELAWKHIKIGILAIIISIAITGSITTIFSHQIGKFFSEDINVIQEFVDTSIYISIYVITDGFSCALSNILRTIGLEKYALNTYFLTYGSGIILGTLLVFVFKVFNQGIGLLVGLFFGVVGFIICGFYKLYTVDLEHQCAEVKKNLAPSFKRSFEASHH
eukprot:TRINITY_DN10403_c0_g4_i3.p1 TRINITY_DN10403_c0_g4~~TRINITY_DN10403_c0_g4_i3.p1  ORF type:complete len:481 (+),score=58.30 TRINITY_DN10403_c0_g4_i3:92-1534(+)